MLMLNLFLVFSDLTYHLVDKGIGRRANQEEAIEKYQDSFRTMSHESVLPGCDFDIPVLLDLFLSSDPSVC